MAPVQAQRTLVKSPPELWAELSDLESLARHLGDFGEIQITRLEPERTVAWEGEHARGTVRLEASGWGTRVTLTAEVPEPEPEPEPPWPEPTPEPPAATAAPPEPPAATAVPLSVEHASRTVLYQKSAEAAAREPEAKVTFFARVRRWFAGPDIEFAPAVVVAPEPEVEPVAVVAPEPVPVPVPVPEPEPAAAPDALAVLTGVLDHLGAAHHRPFSRG